MNDRSTRSDEDALRVVTGTQVDAHYAVHFAHRAIAALPPTHNTRIDALAAMQRAMAELHWAKWHLGSIDGSFADFAPRTTTVTLRDIGNRLRTVIDRCREIVRFCRGGNGLPPADQPRLASAGTEISFYDGVPLVPTICPVVVIGGSSRDMGRQYAQQVIEIYGSWIFERLADRTIQAHEQGELTLWAAELSKAMPEILEFARGWSEGARESGVALNASQALAIWTGYNPPVRNHLHMGAGLHDDESHGVSAYLAARSGTAALRELADLCSGAAAWGRATADGALIAGSTTDHDCTYQATIVAFPDEGNRFIYTPFSVNGSIPSLGRFFMAGHPGMNGKGVAYVHHGGQALDGGSAGGGPKTEWGHGIRRGTSTLHALQFADSALEARDMMLALPVGDPGPILGTAGGLFADAHYGVALEERAGSPANPRPILRETTYNADGTAHDFLYANNNPLSEDPGSWAAVREGTFRYSREAGWHITRASDSGADAPAVVAARLSTKNSAGRNRYLYRRLMERYGHVDVAYMHDIYATSGQVPDGDYDDVRRRWEDGEEWVCSAAHRGNAFTAVIRPSDNGDGVYRACIGPADKFVQVREPSHGYYYFDETNAFWELVLTDKPQDLTGAADKEATTRLKRAEQAVIQSAHLAQSRPLALLRRAREDLKLGRSLSANLHVNVDVHDDKLMATLARAARAFTRTQVRARQVCDEFDDMTG